MNERRRVEHEEVRCRADGEVADVGPSQRRRSPGGTAQAEVIGIGEAPDDDGDDRSLLVPLVRGGEVVGRTTLDEARARHRASLAELPRAEASVGQVMELIASGSGADGG